jgi:hypothetical protein
MLFAFVSTPNNNMHDVAKNEHHRSPTAYNKLQQFFRERIFFIQQKKDVYLYNFPQGKGFYLTNGRNLSLYAR